MFEMPNLVVRQEGVRPLRSCSYRQGEETVSRRLKVMYVPPDLLIKELLSGDFLRCITPCKGITVVNATYDYTLDMYAIVLESPEWPEVADGTRLGGYEPIFRSYPLMDHYIAKRTSEDEPVDPWAV